MHRFIATILLIGCLEIDTKYDFDGLESEPSDALSSSGEDGRTSLLGDLTINDPGAIAAFCERHDIIYGSLTIHGSAIDSLEGLSCLEQVFGNLSIYNTKVENLDGLSNLKHVGGNLLIGEWVVGGTSGGDPNENLVDILALEELTSMDGYYVFEVPSHLETELCDNQLPELLSVWFDNFSPDGRCNNE